MQKDKDKKESLILWCQGSFTLLQCCENKELKFTCQLSSVYWPKNFGVHYHRKSEGKFCTKKRANKPCVWEIWHLVLQTMICMRLKKSQITRQAIVRLIFLCNFYHIQQCWDNWVEVWKKFSIHYNSKGSWIDIYGYTQIVLNLVSFGSKS